MNKDTFTNLHMMRTRGGMAAALMMRGVEPTSEQLVALDNDEIKLRQLGEFYHELGFSVDFTLTDMTGDTGD